MKARRFQFEPDFVPWIGGALFVLLIGGCAIELGTGKDEAHECQITAKSYNPAHWTTELTTDSKGNTTSYSVYHPAEYFLHGHTEDGEGVTIDVSSSAYGQYAEGQKADCTVHVGGIFHTRSAWLGGSR